MCDLKGLIPRLYHFTDEANLQSIREQEGLLPMSELERLGIRPSRPGGNQWSQDADRQKGLDAYVHLCLFENHPMAYLAQRDGRISDLRYLRISRDVLDIDGIRISPDVSNKAGVPTLEVREAMSEVDFEYVQRKLDFTDGGQLAIRRRLERVEILVPGIVPISMIENL